MNNVKDEMSLLLEVCREEPCYCTLNMYCRNAKSYLRSSAGLWENKGMYRLVLFQASVILATSAFHLIAHPKKHLIVHPMDALNIAINSVAVFALGKL
mmetsp:Transcript_13441/g.22334  ORF Transcript_13441/g.22334 Transcript_13441/m.22334 type:complete len:98 (-) Transcript_13441:47-340(-)